MVANGILNSSKEPTARWDCSDVDQETINVTVGERLRFPYASNVAAPNRMMKSAMSEQLATYDKNDMKKSGVPTRELINLYEKFADGGFGTIVTGCIMINGPGKYAADLPHKTDFNINKLTREQIGELINDYAYAASYAQQCGFNGVEISCTYFFALGQLITSSDNTRDDEFGGELENRAKILFKIIQAIRMKICKPSRFVIGLKLFCGNFEPDYNSEAFGEFVHNVEKTGFDYIAITGGNYNLIKDLKREDDPKKCEYFYQKFVLTMRKHLTRTKLFMNGGFVTLSDMVAAIRDGWAAGVSLARPVAAEPDLPKRLFAGEVKSATKSLFDAADYSVEVKFAGSQLWQHGFLLTVMDASNPDHIEQFKKDLHFHEKQKLLASDGDELIIGYPKTIIHPELLDEEMLKRIQQPSKETMSTEPVTLEEHAAAEGDELTTETDDKEREVIEEETHHVVKKQLDYGAPGDFHENTIEDSIRTVVKRHENLDDVGVDIIEETIEKVTLTQSDFSEPPQSESAIELEKQEAEPTSGDVTKQDDEISNAVAETLDASFDDVKTVVESTLEEDVKHVDEMVKDITEGLRKENEEEAEAEALADKDEQHVEMLSPTQQSEMKEATELISGLSEDDKPIISGIVEEAKNADDNIMSTVEHEEKQDNAQNAIDENEKQPITDRETLVGGENYDIDENVVEEVMRKEIQDVSAQMTTSFMEDLMEQQTDLTLGKGDEQFADASEFQHIEGHHELTKSTDKDEQNHLDSHSEENIIEAHAPEGVTEAYIPKDLTEDHIPADEKEHLLERSDEADMTSGLTDNHFQDDMSNGTKDDLGSEVTMSKDVTTDDHAQGYPTAKDDKDQHDAQGFLDGGVGQPGWNELSRDADPYKVSSTTYSTLFGSTLMSGNGESVAYEEYYDKHSVPGQSPEETYHSEMYGIPSGESKDVKSDEKLSDEKVDESQIQPESAADKSVPDNSDITHKQGLTGFISSALSDSVQSLITSTKNKFDEMLSDSDGKHQPDLQFTMKTEEIVGDDGRKYEVHTESYAISDDDHRLSMDFGDTKGFSADDSDKFKMHDDALTSGSTDIHHSIETTITTATSEGDKESKKHRDGLFGDKKSTDELDFEFIH
uniref:Oxidored_FMN domain-containing protein n=1 Tax=Elaeophora elaphi TaxID=1147741 RepID=A0A0R3RZL1_9BILA